MKRNLFLLVLSLMLLSFGQISAQPSLSMSARVPGSFLWNDAGTDKVIPGPMFIEIVWHYDNVGGIELLGGAFVFRVDGPLAKIPGVTGALPAPYDNVVMKNGFQFPSIYWNTFGGTAADWPFAWLQNMDGTMPDTMGHAFAGTAGLPGNLGPTAFYELHYTASAGTITVDSVAPSNDAFDWAFDYPAFFADTSFIVEQPPNLPPSMDNCPTQLTTQHHIDFNYDFDATDPEHDAITYSIVSGPGTINANTGVWTYNPPCTDVGQSITLVVCAADAINTGCTGNQICTVDLVVNNTAPVIGGDCGKTFIVGDAGGSAQFTATDVNTGDTKAWSVTVVPAPVGTYSIDANGLLTFDPDMSELGTDFVFTVTVTDCAGATDDCTVTFETVSALPYEIKIEKIHNQLQGQHAYVPVIKVEGTEEMWGFDFLIAYDASALNFMGALKGDLFDIPGDYEWEYFTYRFGPFGNCGSACPSGMLRVVGMAEQNDGPHHAISKDVPNDFTLFMLDFLVTNDRTLECQFVPIRFFWFDCGDNTIAYRPAINDSLDIITAISLTVTEFGGADLTDPDGPYPSWGGAFGCDNIDPNKPDPVPFIHFQNGGVDIICADSIDARGDVNLNGIANEIGDAVVFTNYFIAGLAAFQVNVDGQIAATDVNADGIVLSVADLVYLIRVIIGDALPYAKLNPYAMTANFSHDGSVVTVDAELGAALFTFAGDVNVSLAEGAAGMEIKTGLVNGNTNVLVYSFEKGKTFSGNILNAEGSLVKVEAVDYFGNTYKVGLLPTAFSVSNYPNPFNAQTVIRLELPKASDYSVTIYNVAGQKVHGWNGHSEAGVLELNWTANVASGIYFYKAEAGANSVTKKMVLLK